jgi:hypothetical protein
MTDKNQTEGREQNAAQPLGERAGLVSNAGARRTAKKEVRSAGPDGPDAKDTSTAIKTKR